MIFIILFLIVGIVVFQDSFSGYLDSKKLNAQIIETEYYKDIYKSVLLNLISA